MKKVEVKLKSTSKTSNSDIAPLVDLIRIYPIKSCRSVVVENVEIINGRMKFDREYAIIDFNKLECLTQKSERKLTMIQPNVNFETNNLTIIIRKKKFILKPPKSPKTLKIMFRKEKIDCLDMGDEVSQFLSDFLKIKVRLVKQILPRSVEDSCNADRNDKLISFSAFENKKFSMNDNVSNELNFGNRTSVCVISNETVDFINNKGKLEKNPIFINEEQYRVNLVIKGCKEFEEETWKTWNLNDLEFNYVRGAPRRCIMTAIDQKSGILDLDIQKFLIKIRGKGGKYPEVGTLVCCSKKHCNGIIKIGNRIFPI